MEGICRPFVESNGTDAVKTFVAGDGKFEKDKELPFPPPTKLGAPLAPELNFGNFGGVNSVDPDIEPTKD